MKRIEGPLPAVLLAFCFHGPLVALGLYRYSWDAATHIFFADHYRQSWFGLWDPRWFTGFSVTSYPPLVHQLLALLSFTFGYQASFAILLLGTLMLFPIGVWRFAQLFVPRGPATAASLAAAVLPGIALAAHAFGQLPTLMSLTVTLFLVAEAGRFVRRGGRLSLGLVAGLGAMAVAAHHATALLFLPPALLAGVSTVLLDLDRGALRPHLYRAAAAAITVMLSGALVIMPFWLWAGSGINQAFIPHNSRSNFLNDLGAQALYLWGIYGVLPALALAGLWLRRNRRTLVLSLLGAFLGLLGLGGTTPLPAMIFGGRWQWLTYDRFALWAAVSLLPLAGVAIHALVSAPRLASRVIATAALTGLAAYSIAAAVSSVAGPSLPFQPDLRPIAQFLNDGRTSWRYQTFGIGDPVAALGTMTDATTIDGTYYSARRVPELARSGIGMLDSALWWDPSGAVLRRLLARADFYSIRWAFVIDPHYDPYLQHAGFALRGTLPGGIAVWENATAPAVAAPALRFGRPDAAGIFWGTLPLASVLLTAAFAIGRVRAARAAVDEPRRWRRPAGVLVAPLGAP